MTRKTITQKRPCSDKKESEKDERLVDRFVLSNIYVTFDYLQTFLDANRAGVLSKTKATTTNVSSIIEFLQWWVLKSKFLPNINTLNGNCCTL